MKELPAQRFALVLSRVAMAGCAISLIAHVLALLSFFSTGLPKFEKVLGFGVFPVLFAAIMAANRLMPVLDPDERLRAWSNPERAKKIQGTLIGCAPRWLRNILTVLMAYTMAVFALAFLQAALQGTGDELRVVSAFAALLYCAAATLLTSYAQAERRITRGEIS